MDREKAKQNENHGRKHAKFFHAACQDVAQMTSVNAFDSKDIIKPRIKQSYFENVVDQLKCYGTAAYFTDFCGLVPYYFKIMPLGLFKLLSISISLYRRSILSPLLPLLDTLSLCSHFN